MNPDDAQILLFDTIKLIEDQSLRQFLYHVFIEGIDLEKFLTCVGGRGRHHSFKGGLCYHTCHATRLASQIVDHYITLGMEVNKDIVLAGVLLHDIGKIECYEYDPDLPQPSPMRGNVMLAIYVTGGWKKTKADRMFHHIPIGYGIVLMAAKKWNAMADVKTSQEDIDHLLHIILSHHGNKCWSSPIIPQTIEAYIVHSIEMMDGYVDSYNNGKIPESIY